MTDYTAGAKGKIVAVALKKRATVAKRKLRIAKDNKL